jgi:hypothetical protein
MAINSKILPVYPLHPIHEKISNPRKKAHGNRYIKLNRRRRSKDRRKSVRNGVFVRLSSKPDRRRGVDRRKKEHPRSEDFGSHLDFNV